MSQLAPSLDFASENSALEAASPQERVAWGLRHFPGKIILSSSFGIQAAVTLHLVTSQAPDIPVIFLDTGYHFPETYKFVDQLTDRLKLNLHIYRSTLSPAWQETRYGKLWEQGIEGLTQYNQLNKVEPMNRALRDLGAEALFAGLRREQANSRKSTSVLTLQNGRVKIHPIIDWTNKTIHEYLTANDLPYHPLWEQGYVSVGDTHSTAKWEEGMTEEQTRFFGLKRECGLHEGGTNFEI
jgi:phosphoadenosine phosphosulfate reductase